MCRCYKENHCVFLYHVLQREAVVRATKRSPILAYTRCSGLARPSAPALQCLEVLSGAGELPRRLGFSCVCAGMVPVAPVVGAVHRVQCGWPALVGWRFLFVCAFDGFLL